MTTLYGGIRERSTDPKPSIEICAEGADYYAAREALYDMVPDGWQLIGISQWSCGSAEAVATREATLSAALERLRAQGAT